MASPSLHIDTKRSIGSNLYVSFEWWVAEKVCQHRHVPKLETKHTMWSNQFPCYPWCDIERPVLFFGIVFNLCFRLWHCLSYWFPKTSCPFVQAARSRDFLIRLTAWPPLSQFSSCSPDFLPLSHSRGGGCFLNNALLSCTHLGWLE